MGLGASKKFLVAIAVLSLPLLTATATDARDTTRPATAPTQRAWQPGEGLFMQRFQDTLKGLDLSQEQKLKVETALAKAKSTAKDLVQQFQSGSMSRAEVSGKWRELTQETRQQIGAILTPEQQTTLQQRLRQVRTATTRPAGNGPLDRFQAALRDLELTSDQKQQVEPLLREAREKMRKAREEAAGDPRAFRDRIHPIVQDFRSQLEMILTPDQTTALHQKLQPARPNHPQDVERGPAR